MRRLVAVMLVAIAVHACGGAPLPPDEPRDTAGARPHKRTGKHGSEAVREPESGDKVSGKGKQWGGWRYGGSRDECFFVVGRKCFASEAAACKAAKCGGKRCVADGGGPATVKCR